MVPAPLEQSHVQQRSVGDLEEADPVAGDARERRAVVTAGQHVEGVDGERDSGWPARTTASQAWPTRLTCRPHASASNATVPPYSAAAPRRRAAARRSGRCRGTSRRRRSSRRGPGAPSSAMTSSLAAPGAATPANRSGGTPCTSRRGWNRSMVRPRSAHRMATSAGGSGLATRSLSKISTPSKPAPAIASSLSASRPLSETVAIPDAIRPASGRVSRIVGVGAVTP